MYVLLKSSYARLTFNPKLDRLDPWRVNRIETSIGGKKPRHVAWQIKGISLWNTVDR